MANMHLSRTEVRRVPCPECGAKAGQRCWGGYGKLRTANHQLRVKRALVMQRLVGGPT